ncbi:hypothetical protein OF83DRAFT_1179915 [Amylostereum chailletii]|nr:hypothetical protein OF83DRAFT_1179915 [Amylostereum chailletii]
MPEIRECIISGLQTRHIFLSNAQADWHLRNLWYDATAAEVKHLPKAHPLKNGYVAILPATSTVMRGVCRRQTPLFPPPLHTSCHSPPGYTLEDLVLKNVLYTSRSLVLDLDKISLQVQYLTHASVQVYSHKQWEVLKRVSHHSVGGSKSASDLKMRTFRVFLGLEFGDFVLAIVSLDNVCQATWADDIGSLPHQDVSVIDEFEKFLEGVATWARRYLPGGRAKGKATAIHVLRNSANGHVWFGIGVSPFLSEAEVFGNPSRLRLVKRCLRWGLLAPTDAEQLEYAFFLYVYGKDFVSISKYMSNLLNEYKAGTPTFDVFEPKYIRNALKCHPQLGAIVFGAKKWSELMPGADADLCNIGGPLSSSYASKGMLNKETHLNLDVYDILFLKTVDMKHRKATTYLCQLTKVVWSLVPHPRSLKSVKTVSSDTRAKSLFRAKVSTRGVAIGPLEYCGNAIPIKKGAVRNAVYETEGTT